MRKPRFDSATTLAAWWDQRERDFMVGYPRRGDGALLLGFLCDPPRRLAVEIVGFPPHESLVKELEARGYDPTTLRFSIQLKEKPREPHVTAVEACPHGCVGACTLCPRPPGSESSAPSKEE